MKEMTLDEVRAAELQILIFIDKFCREHKLAYSLAYGTLIGAIRHKGFIPWDDDIDIIMMRDDYEKFGRLIKEELKENDSKYQYLSLDNNYFNWIKICDSKTVVFEDEDFKIDDYGVWVDVFPVDSTPDLNDKEGIQYRKYYNTIKRFAQWRAVSYSHIKKIPLAQAPLFVISKFLLTIFPINYWGRKLDRLAQKYNKLEPSTRLCGNMFFYNHKPTVSMDDSIFKEYIDTEFEFDKSQRLFMIIKRYDEFLRNIYGDYMAYPPAEQRIPKHGFKAYWKEVSL